MTSSPRDAALSGLAEIADPEVLRCWRVVVEAVDRGWLTADGPLSADTLAAALAAGGGMGAGAYGIRADGDRAAVTYFGERLTCPREPLIDELYRLAGRLREPGPLDAAKLAAAMAALDRISLPVPGESRQGNKPHDPEERPRNGHGGWTGRPRNNATPWTNPADAHSREDVDP